MAPHAEVQFDLFRDNAETILLNDLRRAVTGRRSDEAARLLDRCRRAYPTNPQLPLCERLVEGLSAAGQPARDPESEIERMTGRTAPAARELLGAEAAQFLRPLWRRLADALAGRPFDPGRPRVHASFPAAEAEDWPAVRSSVEAEAGWQRQGVLLLRHARACESLGDPASALADWCRLCWDHPAVAEPALESSTLLGAEWSDFLALDPPLAEEDFPAWLALRGLLPRGTPEEVENTRARECAETLRRLRLHRRHEADAEVIADRRHLRALHPALFDLYMDTLRHHELAL